MLKEEGFDNLVARHHRLAEGTRKAVEGWGLKVCVCVLAVSVRKCACVLKERGWRSDTTKKGSERQSSLSLSLLS